MRISPTSFRNTRRAAIAVQVALTMTVLLGMLAIVVDGGLLQAQRRQQQAAADAAALAYAASMANGAAYELNGVAQTSALAIAAANGAANDGTISKITANTTSGGNPVHGIWSPPISGTFAGNASYVEVVVEYDSARLFSSIWSSSAVPVRARAVANWTVGGANTTFAPSILALGTSGVDITDAGIATITVPGAVIANSSITISGSKAAITSTGGTIDYGPNGSATGGGTYSPAPQQGASITPDPLANLELPDPSSLTTRNVSMPIHSTVTLQPGVYKGGISITGGTVTMSPGIYYMEGGGMSISGQATVTDNGGGVLIYNGETNGTTNNPGSVGGVSLTGQASLAITPMTSGPWKGISFFQDRNASATVDIEGGDNTNVAGMIYAPMSDAKIAGGANIVPGTSFITNTLKVAGNATFTIPTATVKVPIPGTDTGGTVTVVE